jgi:hypothetical protein
MYSLRRCKKFKNGMIKGMQHAAIKVEFISSSELRSSFTWVVLDPRYTQVLLYMLRKVLVDSLHVVQVMIMNRISLLQCHATGWVKCRFKLGCANFGA